MLLPEVDVLLYTHREDSTPEPPAYAARLTELATHVEPYALSVLGAAGLVRMVTNRRSFHHPSTLDRVVAFVEEIAARSFPEIEG